MPQFHIPPRHRHGESTKTAVILINLGTPDAPTPKAVARYLREFLSDRRVVEIPRIVWLVLLHLVVVPLRAAKSAAKYRQVWMKEGSPLKVWTAIQAKLLLGRIGSGDGRVVVDYAMRYGSPSIAEVLDRLADTGATRMLLVPLYPQYSATTTASTWDAVGAWVRGRRYVPELRYVNHYHDHPAYIAALAARVVSFWEQNGRLLWSPNSQEALRSRVILSFHGLPARNLFLGDPYHCECLKTGRLLTEALGLSSEQVLVTFQSRFGRAKWLEPYTSATLTALARDGVENIDAFCPGFPADCLETLEEIAMEGKATFLEAGGKNFRFIPCLNDATAWMDGLAAIVTQQMGGWSLPENPAGEALQLQKTRALAAGSAQ